MGKFLDLYGLPNQDAVHNLDKPTTYNEIETII